MKKVLLFLALSLAPLSLKASQLESYNLLQSSYITHTVTLRQLPAQLPGNVFYSIVVGSVSTGGRIIVYDSSGTANNIVADVDLTVRGVYEYSVSMSSGITYTTSGTNPGITILYRKRR